MQEPSKLVQNRKEPPTWGEVDSLQAELDLTRKKVRGLQRWKDEALEVEKMRKSINDDEFRTHRLNQLGYMWPDFARALIASVKGLEVDHAGLDAWQASVTAKIDFLIAIMDPQTDKRIVRELGAIYRDAAKAALEARQEKEAE